MPLRTLFIFRQPFDIVGGNALFVTRDEHGG